MFHCAGEGQAAKRRRQAVELTQHIDFGAELARVEADAGQLPTWPISVELLEKALEPIVTHKDAYVFMDPVNVDIAPTYYKTVKNPMSFKQILEAVRAEQIVTYGGVLRLLVQTYDNAMLYNVKGSDIYVIAAAMRKFTVAAFADLVRSENGDPAICSRKTGSKSHADSRKRRRW